MRGQLAAILFADIAGYTRLMDNHESATHRRLMALLSEVIRPAIERVSGRIVKNTGDGFLARFESVNSAIEAAASIQQEPARGRAAPLHADRLPHGRSFRRHRRGAA